MAPHRGRRRHHRHHRLSISGEVVEVNDAITAEPALVNSDAAGKAWFFKLKIANRSELGGLMDEAAYQQHTA